MGHEVLDCGFPGNHPGVPIPFIQVLRARYPTIEELNQCDVVLSTYHEYVQPWLEDLYAESWKELKVPVIARFDESMDRDDLKLPQRINTLLEWADYYSFPAVQDAEKFGGHWHPFGCDVTMFHPSPEEQKTFEIGFVGSLYDKRSTYLQKLSPLLPDALTFNHGEVMVRDVSGILPKASTQLLASNYRRFKIFFCLPPMSRLLVCKVFEVMGSGTFLMYPLMPGRALKNNELFKSKQHLVYYDPGYLKENAKTILHYLQNEQEREAIARAGCELVHERYTLEEMLEKILRMAFPADKVLPFKSQPQVTA